MKHHILARDVRKVGQQQGSYTYGEQLERVRAVLGMSRSATNTCAHCTRPSRPCLARPMVCHLAAAVARVHLRALHSQLLRRSVEVAAAAALPQRVHRGMLHIYSGVQ